MKRFVLLFMVLTTVLPNASVLAAAVPTAKSTAPVSQKPKACSKKRAVRVNQYRCRGRLTYWSACRHVRYIRRGGKVYVWTYCRRHHRHHWFRRYYCRQHGRYHYVYARLTPRGAKSSYSVASGQAATSRATIRRQARELRELRRILANQHRIILRQQARLRALAATSRGLVSRQPIVKKPAPASVKKPAVDQTSRAKQQRAARLSPQKTTTKEPMPKSGKAKTPAEIGHKKQAAVLQRVARIVLLTMLAVIVGGAALLAIYVAISWRLVSGVWPRFEIFRRPGLWPRPRRPRWLRWPW